MNTRKLSTKRDYIICSEDGLITGTVTFTYRLACLMAERIRKDINSTAGVVDTRTNRFVSEVIQ